MQGAGMMRARMVLALAALVLSASPVFAAPDPNAQYTPAEREWFHSLRTPDGRLSCCDISDCREIADEREGANGQLEVFVRQEQQWMEVPASAVLHGKNNIIGRPIVCYISRPGHRSGNFMVLCYVPGFGA
jgi:hypothetical protein